MATIFCGPIVLWMLSLIVALRLVWWAPTKGLKRLRMVVGIGLAMILVPLGLMTVVSIATAPWLLYGVPTTNLRSICMYSYSKKTRQVMTFSIPSAYFEYGADRKAGRLHAILQFNWRDLQPWSLLHIGIADTYPPRSPDGDPTTEDNVGDVTIMQTDVRQIPTYEFRDGPYHLSPSPFPGWTRIDYMDFTDMLYTVDIAPPRSTFSFASCSDTLKGRPGICTAEEWYRGHSLRFTFRTAYLSKLDFFRIQLHKLFDSFVSSTPCEQ
ncbi:MAG TPA: hypothetical protein VM659_27640 [Dongiaceae bacterium]|nr:hypothetical protein [Dongiaceae bacterium]